MRLIKPGLSGQAWAPKSVSPSPKPIPTAGRARARLTIPGLGMGGLGLLSPAQQNTSGDVRASVSGEPASHRTAGVDESVAPMVCSFRVRWKWYACDLASHHGA